MRTLTALTILCAAVLAGCAGPQRSPAIEVWTDMKRDGKYMPQAESTLFADGRASRRPVTGTVARGHLKEDVAYTTGTLPDGTMYAGANPLPLNEETFKLGQAKFNTYCAPCHSRVGDGRGIVALKTPSWQPSNLHDDRIRQQADGEIFHTISMGKRSMPGYRFQIAEKDRWAIVAYVRALQRTDGSLADVPEEHKADLQ